MPPLEMHWIHARCSPPPVRAQKTIEDFPSLYDTSSMDAERPPDGSVGDAPPRGASDLRRS